MIRHFRILILPLLLVAGCAPDEPPPAPAASEPRAEQAPNPLLRPFNTPHQVPPFHLTRPGHFVPALEQALDDYSEQVHAIAADPAPTDFHNTVAALEQAADRLRSISAMFYGLYAADGTPELQATAAEFMPLLAEHRSRLLLNGGLLARVEAVAARRPKLAPEQARLLQQTRAALIRHGAGLEAGAQQELLALNTELAALEQRFARNLLRAVAAFELHVEDPDTLAGLPDEVLAEAARLARDRGHASGWVFMADTASVVPVLTHADNRALRATLWRALHNPLDAGNGNDNEALVLDITHLRARRAALLGHASHAAWVLSDSVIGDLDAADAFLAQAWPPVRELALEELSRLAELHTEAGHQDTLQPWDVPYYLERLRQRSATVTEEELRPYFALEQVEEGLFRLANRLWGLRVQARTDIPVYSPGVQALEVTDLHGEHLGVLYLDSARRDSKKNGAWMSVYRPRALASDPPSAVVAVVTNLPAPLGDRPKLLTPEQVVTLFHEFGHALHALMSEAHYPSLAGTATPRDFVEVPAYLLERFALKPELLRLYAFHYRSGQALPDDKVQALQRARATGRGIALAGYLAAARLDLAWHRLDADRPVDSVGAFEQALFDALDLPPALKPQYHSSRFRPIFGGGEDAMYFSHLYADALAADAFHALTADTLINREQAERLRAEVLARGNSRDPVASLRDFLGRDPDPGALLRE